MSIEIDAAMVRRAGEEIILARCELENGNTHEAQRLVEVARARLQAESYWAALGHHQVQGFLNWTIGVDEDLLSLIDIDLSVPASMVFFAVDDFQSMRHHIARRRSGIREDFDDERMELIEEVAGA